jgi:hypothetical protein
MLPLTIYNLNQDKTLNVFREEARQMELKLNVSQYGREWKEIGDILFDYHAKDINKGLLVTDEQFDFLKNLIKKNY